MGLSLSLPLTTLVAILTTLSLSLLHKLHSYIDIFSHSYQLS